MSTDSVATDGNSWSSEAISGDTVDTVADTTTPTSTASLSSAGIGMLETVKTFISSTTLTTPTTSPNPSPSTMSAESEAASSTSAMPQPNVLNVADLSSSMQRFGVIDYCVFVLMLVVCAVIGLYFGFIEKKKNKRKIEHRRGSEALDYLVGGRKMKVFPVSLSLVASFVSGISLLGTSTEIYVYGTQYAFILITLALSGVISWYVFLPVFCNLQLTSTYEYFEMRFGPSIRYFCSALFTVGMILYLPVAIYVPALTFNQVSGINVHVITPIVCLVCTFYTCAGGLKAVIWTDAIQSFVMYGTILTICIKGTFDIGGLDVVLQRNLAGGRLNIPEMTWDPTVRLSIVSVIVGGTLHKIQSSDVNQVSIQRFLSLPTMKQVKATMILFTVLLMILLFCCCYMGLLTYATYHDCDPLTTKLARADDQLPVLLAMRILGAIPGLPGLFVAGVFSAALSSLSTGLNSLACVISQDMVRPLLRSPLSDRQTAVLLRLIVVFFGVGCIGLVFVVERLGTVLQLATMTGAVTMGPLLGFYIMGLCMPWINEKSALVGGVVSFLALGWICINAQIAQLSGQMHHPKLPVSVEGCTYHFGNVTTAPPIADLASPPERNIYHLSFLWYTACGGFISCVVGAVAVLGFGSADVADINPELISPVLRRFLPAKRYTIVPLAEAVPFVGKAAPTNGLRLPKMNSNDFVQ